jgi:plastocyanin
MPFATPFSAAIRHAALAVLGLLAATGQAATVDVVVAGTDGKPLGDAAVFLEAREGKPALKPAAGVEIEQAAKQFTHRVTVVPAGTEIAFPNRDKVRHHVFSFSPSKTFELKLYAGVPANPVLFDKPGIAVLGCNIHDNMVAWVVVVDSPYYGLTTAKAALKLDNVPPGNYRLRAWHPELPPGTPPIEQALTVPAAGNSVTVRLPLTAVASN